MDGDGFQRLARAADVLFEREAAGLKALTGRMRVIDLEVERLRTQQLRAAGPVGGSAFAPAAIAAGRWRDGVQEKLVRLLRERAELAAGFEEARGRAARAYGRTIAIRRLADQPRRR